ncbi:hypothetical protein OURE66S_03577 [Oligella ureolytica]
MSVRYGSGFINIKFCGPLSRFAPRAYRPSSSLCVLSVCSTGVRLSCVYYVLSSGHISHQSSGRSICRVTSPFVSFSMLRQSFNYSGVLMKRLTVLGALVLSCASVSSHAQSSDTLSGTTRLACEAILCLSSSLQPGQCKPSLNHYFDIRKYRKGSFSWGRTVDARRAFLDMCPRFQCAGYENAH